MTIPSVQSTAVILSERPFRLRVVLGAEDPSPGILMAITLWAGKAFVVEQVVSFEDFKRGHNDLHFSKEQSLPAALVTFNLSLITEAGDQAKYTLDSNVLPQGTLDLALSALNNFVTGVAAARTVKLGENFVVDVRVTLRNGQAASVACAAKLLGSSGMAGSTPAPGYNTT